MSLFKKHENNKQSEINNQQEINNQREMIEVYDEFGRKMLISRKNWLDSVLPGQLERHWNEPDALYQDIVLAVQDGFVSEVLAASKRLFEIDPIKERCYTILAIVYMKLNYLKEAENLLLEYIRSYGKTGTILTNLAKVYSAKNEDEKSQDILWESISIDPNQDNGFAWWALRARRGARLLRRNYAAPGALQSGGI
jgi:tetratricopeptide (TPR) repeat protein